MQKSSDVFLAVYTYIELWRSSSTSKRFFTGTADHGHRHSWAWDVVSKTLVPCFTINWFQKQLIPVSYSSRVGRGCKEGRWRIIVTKDTTCGCQRWLQNWHVIKFIIPDCNLRRAIQEFHGSPEPFIIKTEYGAMRYNRRHLTKYHNLVDSDISKKDIPKK